jgi:hypothetical protein
MFTTKKESSDSSPTSAVRASATTIETSASTTGTRPATTVPKTRTRMISAPGRPKYSSPSSRSRCERSVKSRSMVSSPVTAASNAASASARRTASITSSIVSSGTPPSWIGIRTAWRSADGCGSPTTRTSSPDRACSAKRSKAGSSTV